jgi:hypothetical protein
METRKRKTLDEAVRDGDEYWFKDEETEKQYMDQMFLDICLILGLYEQNNIHT